MKSKCSVSFHNFWPSFDPHNNFFKSSLSLVFDVSVVPYGRDLQIFSVFGKHVPPEPNGPATLDKSRSRPIRTWYSGETVPATNRIYDLWFSFWANPLMAGRSFRYPLWILDIDWFGPASPKHPGRLLAPRQPTQRKKFCNFIYSHPVSFRSEFCLRLSRYKQVEGLGRSLNTTGFQVEDKLAAMKEFRFAIAFENTLAPGYVTEKLFHALLCGCIPIYWGAREALTDFNPEAFIFAEDFSSFDELIDYIVALDRDEARVAAMQSAPIFRGNRPPYEHTPQFFADRIAEALSADRTQIPQEWDDRLQQQLPREDRKLKRNFVAFRGALLRTARILR